MTLRASSRSAVQSRFARILRSLLLGLLTAHAATTHAVADNTRAAPGRPKLIVLITIDGLPQRQVLSYRNQLAPMDSTASCSAAAGLPTRTTGMPSPSRPLATPPC
jgi:predicted AlkP superfamily pyrophosphatase or phosphodiesterase